MEFLEKQAILRKSKTPRKSPEKWTFLSLSFYNAPSCTLLMININKFAGLSRDSVGAKKLFMFFPYGEEETHKQSTPQNSGTIP